MVPAPLQSIIGLIALPASEPRATPNERFRILVCKGRAQSLTSSPDSRPYPLRNSGESAGRARNHYGMTAPAPADPGDDDLIRRAAAGDAAALDELFTRYRPRLRRMVKLRLDPRVQGRVDASDVVQEAYLEVSQKLADYLHDPRLPFFL